MGKHTQRNTRALLLLVVAALLLAACSPERDGAVDRLLMTEPDPVDRDDADPERIRELERDVERYREQVEEALRAVGESANAHRLLGMRFLDQQMYGPALEQFTQAVDIQSENPTLFYYVGIAAGLHAQAATDRVEQETRFQQAERAYLRALELRPRYAAAAYALSVLLAYELDRPQDALEYADIAIDVRPQNDRAHAVRAYALSALGRVEEAIRAYDLVIENATDEQTRSTARSLQQELRSQ